MAKCEITTHLRKDGVVIIPQDKVIDNLEKSEKLINTESQVRKAIEKEWIHKKRILSIAFFK